MGLPDGDSGGRWAPGGGGMGLPDGERGGPPGPPAPLGPPCAGRLGAPEEPVPPAPPRDTGDDGAEPDPGDPKDPEGRAGAPVRGGAGVRPGGAGRIGGAGDPDCDCMGGRGGAGIGGRRAMPRSPPCAGGDVESGRLVTRRESLGRGAPLGGGGIGGPVRGAPKGAAGAGRGAGWSSGGRGGVGAEAGAPASPVPAMAGLVTVSGAAGSGAVAAGTSGGASLVVTRPTRAGNGSAGEDSLGPTGRDGSDSEPSPRPRLRPLISAGSSGCLSRRNPSRSALRRTRSAWASSMLDEWLVTPMPRSRQRSNASLLVRPSSRPSSYTRIFLAKSYVNPFLRRHRRRHLSLSSHVLELSYEAWRRLR
jgi:hypothetical protein